MKLYCLIENGNVVQGPLPLPINLVNKSDFELLELGWYYTECIRPDSFVDRYEIWLPNQYDIQQYKVICTFVKRNKTQEELDIQNAEKQVLVEADKTSRLEFANTFMQSEDYTKLSQAIQDEWQTYVQVIINTITTDLGDAIWDVSFPMLPKTTQEGV